MTRHEATFEITEQTDAHAVRRILDGLYDTVREESKSASNNTDDGAELLAQFESLRDAAVQPSPGKLTITYEQYDDTFED